MGSIDQRGIERRGHPSGKATPEQALYEGPESSGRLSYVARHAKPHMRCAIRRVFDPEFETSRAHEPKAQNITAVEIVERAICAFANFRQLSDKGHERTVMRVESAHREARRNGWIMRQELDAERPILAADECFWVF